MARCPSGTRKSSKYDGCVSKEGDKLIRDNVLVEWEDIGEGYTGYYDADNPEDTKLLRFYISVIDEEGDYHELQDASYCTRFPVDSTVKEKLSGLKLIMDAVEDDVKSERSIKKTCERLSWIGKDWLE